MHKAPRVFDEQLMYKAGASFYDAIRWLEQECLVQQPHPIITELGLLDAFAADTAHSIFDHWFTAQQWMRHKLTTEQYQAFDAHYYADDSDRLLSLKARDLAQRLQTALDQASGKQRHRRLRHVLRYAIQPALRRL
jgi:hypothetical protein